MYYYVLEEYRVSNELLTEDIYVRFCGLESESHKLARQIACLADHLPQTLATALKDEQ